ncbi:MAG: biotin/lipoyl-containing protein [Oscillospiraceae bacterium]
MEIKARISGQIVEVTAKEGDTVAVRQPLGKMEAMKMEQPILSPVAGTVKQVIAKAGTKVKSGEVLFVVE